MVYTFLKEILSNHYLPAHGNVANMSCYTLFDNENLAGQFFYKNEICFFTYGKHKFYIKSTQHWLKRPEHALIDELTGNVIGEYRVPGYGWEIGNLILPRERVYTCEKVRTGKRYSIFDRTTWRQYKVQLTNGVNAVSYSFQIDAPMFFAGSKAKWPFKGSLELWGNDPLIVFAGMFLLEQMFKTEDESGG